MLTKSQNASLVVRKLCLTIKDKQILHDVNFMANYGELLAIMGPTGSGKTSLLNVVSGRESTATGEITLNGMPYNKQLRRNLTYVLQDDLFMTNLTLYETLYFAAMLRIPEEVPKSDKLQTIQHIVNALDLQKCLHTVIGNALVRGLSGGEKKRANIACEILSDPDILLLDEPTSGLDSSTAYSLMTRLRNYATTYNKIIVTTIHQPSSQIYHMFCSLLLLLDGHVTYFGKASEALNYFEDMGFPCEIHFNPADFLLDLLKSDEESKEQILQMAKYRGYFECKLDQTVDNGNIASKIATSRETCTTNISVIEMPEYNTRLSENNTVKHSHITPEKSTDQKQKWPTSFWTQYRMLTWRQFKQSKTHILSPYEVVQAVITALVSGIVFFQIKPNYDTLRDQLGIALFGAAYWGFRITVAVLTGFPLERGIIQKERRAGVYRLSAYYCSSITSDLPLIVVIPLVYHTIVFLMSGMASLGADMYFMFIGINLLFCLLVQSISHIIGASTTDFKLSMSVAYSYFLSSMLLSGYFNAHVPEYLDWMKYFSVTHYCYSSINILYAEKSGIGNFWCNATSVPVYHLCKSNTTSMLTTREVMKDVGMDLPYFCYIYSIAVFLVFFRILGYYILRWKGT